MVKHNQLNTLLMEILIVVLFFALCSTVILDVFVGAHNQSARAGAQADALTAAQSLADRLYAADAHMRRLTGASDCARAAFLNAGTVRGI